MAIFSLLLFTWFSQSECVFSMCCVRFGLIYVSLKCYCWNTAQCNKEAGLLQLHLLIRKSWSTFWSYLMQFKQVLQSMKKREFIKFQICAVLCIATERVGMELSIQHTKVWCKSHRKVRMRISESLTSKQNWAAPKAFRIYQFN